MQSPAARRPVLAQLSLSQEHPNRLRPRPSSQRSASNLLTPSNDVHVHSLSPEPADWDHNLSVVSSYNYPTFGSQHRSGSQPYLPELSRHDSDKPGYQRHCNARLASDQHRLSSASSLETLADKPTPRKPTSLRLIFQSWFNLPLVLTPITAVLVFSHSPHTLIISLGSLLGLIPLIRLHDLGTASLAGRIGGSRTGLVNATLSNTVALILALSALRRCELRVLQSTLNGHVLCKLLLVLGACFLAGGSRFREQAFDTAAAHVHISLLGLGMNALLIPAVFHFVFPNRNGFENASNNNDGARGDILKMSRGVSIILILIYAAYLFFQLKSHDHLYDDEDRKGSSRHLSFCSAKEKMPKGSEVDLDMEKTGMGAPMQTLLEKGMFYGSLPKSGMDNDRTAVNSPVECTGSDQEDVQLSWTVTILLLISATTLIAVHVEWLVSNLDGLPISREWLSLILIPSVTAFAECLTAVSVAAQDQTTLVMAVAIGSAIQTLIFVIPCVVLLGWAIDRPVGLLFDPFESIVLYLSVATMSSVVGDGKSNWMEGVILMSLYVIIAVCFWFYPGSTFSSTLATCPAVR